MKYIKLKKETVIALSFMFLFLTIPSKLQPSAHINTQELAAQSNNALNDTSPTIEHSILNSATRITPNQEPEVSSFSITMPKDILEEQELELSRNELAEKIKQMHISAGATSILAVLTVYYACNTNPSEWLSGTAGSFCANMLLTTMATNFLRNDKNNMQKRLSFQKK